MQTQRPYTRCQGFPPGGTLLNGHYRQPRQGPENRQIKRHDLSPQRPVHADGGMVGVMADVQRLTAEDRLEIQELLHRYMFILDAGENHGSGYGYADLFTEDGTFGTRLPGREGLAAAAGRTVSGGYTEVHQRGPHNQIHINVGEIIVPTAE